MPQRVLEGWLAELPERNRDNVARTDSYLELYTWSLAHPPELPWLLMAHLVSRNAGYLMTDLARVIGQAESGERPTVFTPAALRELFVFLERANWLIFNDAWWHVLHLMLGRPERLTSPRTPQLILGAYRRFGAAPPAADRERALVLDLVTNEQNYIERRVVHHPRFAAARAIVGFTEAVRRETPINMPHSDAVITVGGFAQLDKRIAAGRRIFDEILADRTRRAAIHDWALSHPHTGSRAVYGGPAGVSLRAAWPLTTVHSLWDGIHAAPEPDPHYP